jgi:hypothetical protein
MLLGKDPLNSPRRPPVGILWKSSIKIEWVKF